jgi:hypothetical protein
MDRDPTTMLLTGAALGCGGVLFLGGLLLAILKRRDLALVDCLRRGLRNNSHREAVNSLGDFSAELEGVKQKFNILETYITEYFNTFQAAGWEDLRLLLDDLQLTEDSLKLLLENRRYKDVKEISDYLMGRLNDAQASSLVQRYDGLEPLQEWRTQSRSVLLRVVRASMDSAKRTAAVGIRRKRATKPTLVTLAELRTVLGDSNN